MKGGFLLYFLLFITAITIALIFIYSQEQIRPYINIDKNYIDWNSINTGSIDFNALSQTSLEKRQTIFDFGDALLNVLVYGSIMIMFIAVFMSIKSHIFKD